MIILASSSVTRAKVLQDHGVKFEQVFFDYDEGGMDKNLPPHVYVQKIVAAKKEQFLKANALLELKALMTGTIPKFV